MSVDFTSVADVPLSPSRAPFAITPSDSDPLPATPKGIYVGTGGDVRLRGISGAGDVTYRNLLSGSDIGVAAAQVYATGTTASDLIGEA